MAERLAHGVWYLDLGWPAPLGANAYLVEDDAVTLVDAGLPLNARRIRRELADTGFDPADIDRVLITHYDLDHVGGLARLAPELDAPVYMGEADIALMDGTARPPRNHPKGIFHRGLRVVHRLPSTLEVIPVADGDRIGGFTVHHTPGHNPGHAAYVHEGRDVGLLGDLVWENGGQFTTPIWLDSYDMGVLAASVRRLAAEASPFEVACMGHGSPLRSGGSTALRALADRLGAEV